MKFYIINYSFFSDKVNQPRKIVLISDLHDMFKDPVKAKGLIEAVNRLGGHHVAIAGDVMQGVKYSDPESCKKLAYLLEGIAEAQPVAMSLGNHDLVWLTEEGRKNFRNLSHNPNVHTLDNESFIQDEFRITGFSTDRKAYAPTSFTSGENKTLFAEDWNKAGISINPNSKYFEELVGHAPQPLASPYVQQNAVGISDMDLYLTGHLHNGYLPLEMPPLVRHIIKDKGILEMFAIKFSNGLIIPNLFFIPVNLCRGLHFVGKEGVIKTTLDDGFTYYKKNRDKDLPSTPLVISGGINRYFGIPSAGEITVIDILPEETKTR